jgi:hypothetical protein
VIRTHKICRVPFKLFFVLDIKDYSCRYTRLLNKKRILVIFIFVFVQSLLKFIRMPNYKRELKFIAIANNTLYEHIIIVVQIIEEFK